VKCSRRKAMKLQPLPYQTKDTPEPLEFESAFARPVAIVTVTFPLITILVGIHHAAREPFYGPVMLVDVILQIVIPSIVVFCWLLSTLWLIAQLRRRKHIVAASLALVWCLGNATVLFLLSANYVQDLIEYTSRM
jgi:hypothetical protein